MNKYTAKPIVCDTGVFMNGELQIVCKHSKNAEIIAEIMNMDAREETADVEKVVHCSECKFFNIRERTTDGLCRCDVNKIWQIASCRPYRKPIDFCSRGAKMDVEDKR